MFSDLKLRYSNAKLYCRNIHKVASCWNVFTVAIFTVGLIACSSSLDATQHNELPNAMNTFIGIFTEI